MSKAPGLTYLIYKHICNVSGKAYIGQTCDLEARTQYHQYPSSKCVVFRNAIQKHGWNNFTTEVLAEGLTLEIANQLEERFIQEHKTLSPSGYNLRAGGLNRILAEESRKKISETTKGRKLGPRRK